MSPASGAEFIGRQGQSASGAIQRHSSLEVRAGRGRHFHYHISWLSSSHSPAPALTPAGEARSPSTLLVASDRRARTHQGPPRKDDDTKVDADLAQLAQEVTRKRHFEGDGEGEEDDDGSDVEDMTVPQKRGKSSRQSPAKDGREERIFHPGVHRGGYWHRADGSVWEGFTAADRITGITRRLRPR